MLSGTSPFEWNVGNSFQMVQFDPGIELYSFASLYNGLVMMVKKRKEVGETVESVETNVNTYMCIVF